MNKQVMGEARGLLDTSKLSQGAAGGVCRREPHAPLPVHPFPMAALAASATSQALSVCLRPQSLLLLQMPARLSQCRGVTLPVCLDGDMGEHRWPRAEAVAGAGWRWVGCCWQHHCALQESDTTASWGRRRQQASKATYSARS